MGRGVLAMGVEWTLVTLSLSFIALRIAVRHFYHHARPNISDILVIIGWVFMLAAVACDTLTAQAGGMEPLETVFTDDQYIYQLKISYADDILTDMAFYFPKLSLIALYYTIISPVVPKLRIALYIITAYVIVAAILTLCFDTFWCSPISSNWSLEPGACIIFASNTLSFTNWSLNMSSDLAIFILPFFMLRHLRLSRKQLAGLVATFLLGAITILCSVARLTVLQLNTFTENYGPIYILYSAEANISLILVCIPLLKPLVRGKRGRRSTGGTDSTGGYLRSAELESQGTETKFTEAKIDDAQFITLS